MKVFVKCAFDLALSIKLCIEYDNHNKSLISNCREFVVGSVKVYKSY